MFKRDVWLLYENYRLAELVDKQQFYFYQLTEAHNEACDLRWKFEQRVQELEKKLELTHCHACDWPQCPGITGK